MAFISKTGISTNNTIEASQITNIIDAFDGTTANQIYMSGPVTASNLAATGSMFGTFTGPLTGNASTATTATTATTAVTASHAIKAQNAFTASLAVSSSYSVSSYLSVSASYATFSATSTSSSFATTASYVLNAVSSSYAATSSYSDYSSFTQVKTVPLIYTSYGSGSRLIAASGLVEIASTVVPIATLGFEGSSYAGANNLSPYATSAGTEPLYVKFAVMGSGSLGLNGGTGAVPYIVGPTEVIDVDCYVNQPNTAGGSAGVANLSWTTDTLAGSNSAYGYLWNNGVGPFYRVETAWQQVTMGGFVTDSFLGITLKLSNGTTKAMTIDNVTMYLSLKKP